MPFKAHTAALSQLGRRFDANLGQQKGTLHSCILPRGKPILIFNDSNGGHCRCVLVRSAIVSSRTRCTSEPNRDTDNVFV